MNNGTFGSRVGRRYLNRANLSARTETEAAVQRSARHARRLIESDELLSQTELKRLDTQLRISDAHRRREAELANYEARTHIRNMRAWILTFNLVVACAYGLVPLISGKSISALPVDLWHLVVSI
jgi:hypothetical protein